MTLRTALVTGASAGIGRELVCQLVRDRGFTAVLATARRADRLEALAAELPEGTVIPMAGDLGDPEFRARLWERAEALPGGCDVLINNAGLGYYDRFERQDPDHLRRILEINVLALMDLTQRAVRHMLARGGGQVVQVSSVLGSFGWPYSAAYVASKHAVNGLVTSMAHELRGSPVRVWAACPGRTVSEFHDAALGHDVDQHPPRPSLGAEPTDRVARGILRGLDRRRTLLCPTLQSATTVWMSRWLAWPFRWAVGRWGRDYVARELERERTTS